MKKDTYEIKRSGPGSPEKSDVDYYKRMEKAMETLRQSVDSGEISIDTVLELIRKVEQGPLTKFSFLNTNDGRELTAHQIIIGWYGSSIDGYKGAIKAGNTTAFLKEQEIAGVLAHRIIDSYDVYDGRIQAQYGPFAKHVDVATLIRESAIAGVSDADRALLADPETVAFVRDKVWGVAVPNIAYTNRLKNQLNNDFKVSK